MDFTVINDLHIGSKYNDIKDAEFRLKYKTSRDAILIGDIVDLVCCKPKDVKKLEDLRKELKVQFGSYDDGNHEATSLRYSHITRSLPNGKRVLFVHGDLEANPDKWNEYRKRPHGAGFWKQIQTSIFDKMDFLKALRPLPNGFLQRAADEARDNGCEYYVCGHFHPSKEMRIKHEGITIIILPMGFNTVKI